MPMPAARPAMPAPTIIIRNDFLALYSQLRSSLKDSMTERSIMSVTKCGLVSYLCWIKIAIKITILPEHLFKLMQTFVTQSATANPARHQGSDLGGDGRRLKRTTSGEVFVNADRGVVQEIASKTTTPSTSPGREKAKRLMSAIG